jgi:hypothetical protein
MTGRARFAARPGSAEAWVRAAQTPSSDFTARLTVDVTPELRGRIKVTAFGRGQTVADMLRALLEREFGGDGEARR